jgi:ADP-ribose pyrophosphatase
MDINRPESKQPMPPHAKKVFEGIVFDVYQWEQELFDGSKATFEKLKRADTVICFPVLPDGRIVVEDQEQPGKPAFVSGVGGRVEKDETPFEAVEREMLEETGLKAERFVLWKALQPTSKVDWAIYYFIAKGVEIVSEANPEGGEKINLKYLTLDEFIELGFDERFSEREIVPFLIRAKFDPEVRKELEELFDPNL